MNLRTVFTPEYPFYAPQHKFSLVFDRCDSCSSPTLGGTLTDFEGYCPPSFLLAVHERAIQVFLTHDSSTFFRGLFFSLGGKP